MSTDAAELFYRGSVGFYGHLEAAAQAEQTSQPSQDTGDCTVC